MAQRSCALDAMVFMELTGKDILRILCWGSVGAAGALLVLWVWLPW